MDEPYYPYPITQYLWSQHDSHIIYYVLKLIYSTVHYVYFSKINYISCFQMFAKQITRPLNIQNLYE